MSPRNISPIIPGTPKDLEGALFTPIREGTPSGPSDLQAGAPRSAAEDFEIISDISSAVVRGKETKSITSPPSEEDKKPQQP